MESVACGGPLQTHDERFAAKDVAGTLVHGSGQDVVVHGCGGVEEVLQELDAIAAVACTSPETIYISPETDQNPRPSEGEINKFRRPPLGSIIESQ